MKKLLLLLFALAGICNAQAVPVSLTPIPGPFLYTNGPLAGGPLAFGCVFTFASGTSTPLGTYTDASGLTLNPNPTPLNAGGFAQLWFQSGLIYDIRVSASGGTNCSSGQTQYTVRNVNTTLLNLANTWQDVQTFADPLSILPSDLQIVFGTSGSQTTLDIPPTPGNLILHGPPITANDTLVSQNATQTLTNKTESSPIINLPTINGCKQTNGVGSCIVTQNLSTTGTTLNTLTKLANTGGAAAVVIASIGDMGGVIGITSAGAGTTGNATIITGGDGVACAFDGGTVSGDYVQISTTVAGNCHDSGIAPPAFPFNGQVVGRTTSNNSGAGTYTILLFGPEQRASSSVVSSDASGTTVDAAVTTLQLMKQATFPGNTLGAGSTIRLTGAMFIVPGGGSSNQNAFIGFGNSPGTFSSNIALAETLGGNTSDWLSAFQVTCVVATPGVSGVLNCASLTSSSIALPGPQIFSITANLTAALYVGIQCQFTVASTSNNCTQTMLLAEQPN